MINWFRKKMVERKALMMLANVLTETQYREPLKDTDDQMWIPISLDGSKKQLTQMDLENLRKVSRELYLKNPFGRGVIRSFEKFVIGKCMQFSPVYGEDFDDTKVKDYNGQFAEWWTDFTVINRFRRRQKETVVRTLRDGEAFLRYFENVQDVPKGVLVLRFLEPDGVLGNEQGYVQGIKKDEKDAETIDSVLYKDSPIAGEEIQHIKIGVDMSDYRGIPFLTCVAERVRKYDTWLEDRIVLNKVRSAVALLRKHKGRTPTDIAAFADNQKTGDVTLQQGGSVSTDARVQRMRRGGVHDVSANIEYEFLSPNIDAKDVAQDGRSILLSVAAGCGLAEYAVTADASNANFASTMVSEAPMVKDFEEWQDFFSIEFEMIYTRAVLYAIEKNRLPEDFPTGVTIEPLKIITRDRLNEAKADEILHAHDVLAPQTWAQKEGLNYANEQEKIKEHDEREVGYEPKDHGAPPVPIGQEEEEEEEVEEEEES